MLVIPHRIQGPSYRGVTAQTDDMEAAIITIFIITVEEDTEEETDINLQRYLTEDIDVEMKAQEDQGSPIDLPNATKSTTGPTSVNGTAFKACRNYAIQEWFSLHEI